MAGPDKARGPDAAATGPDAPAGAVMELRPDRLANGGESVARAADGRVVFVRGAIPGETVVAQVTDTRRDAFWRAETVEVIAPAASRVESICPAAARGAGCCDLAFIEPSAARGLKAASLGDVLVRVGGLSADVVDGWMGGEGLRSLGAPATGWRIRTRLAVDADGRAGLRHRHGSALVTDSVCVQPLPGLVDDLGDRRFTPGAELVAVADRSGGRHLAELAPVHAPVQRGRKGTDRRRDAQRRRRSRDAPRSLRVLDGTELAQHQVGERVWSIPVTGFWQAHRDAPEVYAQTVADFVLGSACPDPTVCWDLYGGAGIFAGALADHTGATAVHLVDSDTAALAAAAGVFADDPRLHTHQGEVADIVPGLPAPDVVVLDPPRTGAGARVIDRITAADPTVVIHVGCDAARFARDLALFAERGYAITDLRAFDAFPLTHHVEAIACLTRAR